VDTRVEDEDVVLEEDFVAFLVEELAFGRVAC
jgi:hypothetical protein